MRGDKTLQDFLYEDDKRRRQEAARLKEKFEKERAQPKEKKFVN